MHLFTYSTFKYAVTLKPGLRVTQGHQTETYRSVAQTPLIRFVVQQAVQQIHNKSN